MRSLLILFLICSYVCAKGRPQLFMGIKVDTMNGTWDTFQFYESHIYF